MITKTKTNEELTRLVNETMEDWLDLPGDYDTQEDKYIELMKLQILMNIANSLDNLNYLISIK